MLEGGGDIPGRDLEGIIVVLPGAQPDPHRHDREIQGLKMEIPDDADYPGLFKLAAGPKPPSYGIRPAERPDGRFVHDHRIALVAGMVGREVPSL